MCLFLLFHSKLYCIVLFIIVLFVLLFTYSCSACRIVIHVVLIKRLKLQKFKNGFLFFGYLLHNYSSIIIAEVV